MTVKADSWRDDKYTRVYLGPIASEAVESLMKLSPVWENKLIGVGTESIYLHPAIRKIEIDLGGETPLIIEVQRHR